ncbi:dnaJ homolog subfamily C member 7 isoform X1 [Bradysia coprophila]|uniref:dnaJ homolog subfamily C member 7 isoform X1 n=1 Tax=Bradysia coprophila TaxID=38358 RepID=UPI00187DCDF8|nr:dnaJ homolog subfamily C member 7 isoform X1 [Bradysia coprophila]
MRNPIKSGKKIYGDCSIAEEKKNEGNEHYKAQNYKQALRLYSDAITICPETPAYYGNRAACYMMLGDFKSALADSRHSIFLDSKFEKSYIRIVKCCLALGDIVGCEQAIKKLLENDPKNLAVNVELENCKQLRALEGKAFSSYNQKDYRTALYHTDGCLKYAPASLKYKLLKAECLVLLGRIGDANDLAVLCMQADSSNAEAVYVRGLCLYYKDNLEKGLIHFERALSLDPDNKNAREMRFKAKNLKEKKELGNELFKTGKLRDAQTAYTEALVIDPTNKDMNSKLFYNRALVNSRLAVHADAVRDCTSALDNNPAYLKALILRAKSHNAMEKYEECVKDYEAALKMERTSEIKNLLKEAKHSLKLSKRKDYYKILGIDKYATDNDIKKAYRKRALVHHPDRHANASDEEKREQERQFKEVGEAYTILSDSQKKSRYDNGQDLDEDHSGFDPNQMYRQFFQYSAGPTFGFSFN